MTIVACKKTGATLIQAAEMTTARAVIKAKASKADSRVAATRISIRLILKKTTTWTNGAEAVEASPKVVPGLVTQGALIAIMMVELAKVAESRTKSERATRGMKTRMTSKIWLTTMMTMSAQVLWWARFSQVTSRKTRTALASQIQIQLTVIASIRNLLWGPEVRCQGAQSGAVLSEAGLVRVIEERKRGADKKRGKLYLPSTKKARSQKKRVILELNEKVTTIPPT